MRMARNVAVAGMLLIAPACGSPLAERNVVKSNDANSASHVIEKIGLKLPASANIEYFKYLPGMDDSARLVLTLAEADWPPLLAQINAKSEREVVFAASDNFLLSDDGQDWKPSVTPGLETGQAALANAEWLNVGVAPNGPGRLRVFLFWHRT